MLLASKKNSIIGDPMSVNPASRDYNFTLGSPAWTLGLKPIPFEKIGIQKND